MALNLSYSLADQDFQRTKSLGVWNVSRQLLDHLAACPEIGRLTVFTNRNHRNIHLPPNAKLEPHNTAVSGRLGRIYWDQWGAYSAARQSGNSWLFLPKGFASVVRRCPVRLAAYVHDAMHDHYRSVYKPNPLESEGEYFIRSLKATLQSAEVIFTNTEFTRSEVQRLAREWSLPLPRLIHAGVGFDIPKNHIGEHRQRIVVLAGPWPHKCTPLAIEYLQRWVRERASAPGVDWIGAMPPDVSLPMRKGWRHYVRLAQDDYEKVLRDAAVLVYFSAYEGYGMPPVEGTLAGAAAVYSDIPSMTEVMGNCGFRFKNESYNEFAHALDSAIAVPREQVTEWRSQLLARHNWPKVAHRIASELSALEAERPSRVRPITGETEKQRKVLVFAHTPPPHHGQSYMIKLMLDGFGGDQRGRVASPSTSHAIFCHHVNSRLSRRMEEIGEERPGKLLLLFWYCVEAVWCRFRYGANTFYYVPAPGKTSALLRDWFVFALCRPFYKHVILHWHAAGLADWLKTKRTRFADALTCWLLGRPDLSIVLSNYNRSDAEHLHSRNVTIVNNGIPDPCPDFETAVLPARVAKARLIQDWLTKPAAELTDPPPTFTILFLGTCMRSKGTFDALEGFLVLRERLEREGKRVRLQLQVGGTFSNPDEQMEFEERIKKSGAKNDVHLLGFVSGSRKDEILRSADLLCFPTYYPGENQPLVLIESLAYGLPAVTTTWRGVADILPPNHLGLVPPKDVAAVADALRLMMAFTGHQHLRNHFREQFTVAAHLQQLAKAIHSVI